MFGLKERPYTDWIRDQYRFLFGSTTAGKTLARQKIAVTRAWLFQILRRDALRNLARLARFMAKRSIIGLVKQLSAN
jgi:hypothetical protein